MNPHIPHHKGSNGSVHLSYTVSASEVSIVVLCQLCSPPLHSSANQECSKSTSVSKVATMKNMDGAMHPSYR